jgi:hypothetical protein
VDLHLAGDRTDRERALKSARGEDPLPLLSLAEEGLTRAITVAPDHTDALKERARLRSPRAEILERTGNGGRAYRNYADAARELDPLLDRCRKRAAALKP